MQNGFTEIIDFTLIYNRYKRKLYNYVFKMITEKFTAEDIIQNVFLKFYENLDNIKNLHNPQAWLFTTARNEVFTYIRKKKIKSEAYMDEDFDLVSNDNLQWKIEGSELKDMIEKEINILPDELKEVLILREYSELTYREISEILKTDEGLVKGRIFRARKKIIERLSKIAR